jgi:hypothetical protein
MKPIGYIYLVWIASIILLATSQACSLVNNIEQDGTTYLTPIPWQTVSAAQIGDPIINKFEAVIAAQRALGTTRLRSSGTPRAVFVDRLRYEDASRNFIPPEASAADRYPADTQVWLVVFAGHWRVEGGPEAPESAALPTPLPSLTSERCVFVLFPASEEVQGRTVSGIYDCEIWK